MRFLVRLLASAVALGAAAWIVDGITVTGDDTTSQVITLLIVALIFGVINAVVRPILTLLSLPVVLLTLGLFLVVINGAVLALVGWIAGLLDVPFAIEGFWAAVLGAIVISVVSFLIDVILPDEYER